MLVCPAVGRRLDQLPSLVKKVAELSLVIYALLGMRIVSLEREAAGGLVVDPGPVFQRQTNGPGVRIVAANVAVPAFSSTTPSSVSALSP